MSVTEGAITKRFISFRKKVVFPVVVFAVLINLLLIRSKVSIALPDRLQDLVTLSLSILIESVPFILLGILISIAVQIWLPDKFLIKRLPKNPILRRVSISLLGMFLPVCECGNIPLTRGMIRQGMSVSESLTFLLASPILNPVTIITTHQAFGSDNRILIARILGGFFISNIIGWLFSKHPDQHELLTKKFSKSCEVDHTHKDKTKTQKSIEIFTSEASNIMPALLFGSLLAGVIQVVISRDALLSIGSNPVISIGVMMVLAFIVSICSNVDAFFALAFRSTFTTGSIVSFLIFGPLIDIKMLALMRTTFQRKTIIQITAVVSVLSALLGLVVNYAL